MKILLVTNMYPSVNAPTYGIFVKEQEIAVCKEYPDVEYTIAFIDVSFNNAKIEDVVCGSSALVASSQRRIFGSED